MDAIIIQKNILRSRWEYLERDLDNLMAAGKSAEEILHKYAKQFDHTEMMKE